MTTPTQYPLTYEDPCQQEEGCSDLVCGNKVKENNRPQVFCEDVTINKTLTSGLITTISPFTVDELGFCPGTVETLTGPVTVLLLCGEGGPAGGVSAGATCPDQLKVNGPFVVVGEACFNSTVKIESDTEIDGNLSSKDFLSKGNAEVSGDFSVGGSMEVPGDLSTGGNVVSEGTVFSKEQVSEGNSFSSQLVSDSLFTGKIVVNGYLYEEKIITALVEGEETEITVLVKTSELAAPERSSKPTVLVEKPAPPTAPCPSVEC